jgi:uracil-DNA glycosylase
MSLRILLIGSNPSTASSTDEAFSADTVSGRVVRSWIQGIDGTILFDNIVSQITKNNRPLHPNEIMCASESLLERINRIDPDRLIALGKSAAWALNELKLNFLEMPHPSGLNRKLNDKAYVTEKLELLRAYCKSEKIPLLHHRTSTIRTYK